MPDAGTIDTSIYKQAGDADPFDFQNKLLANQRNQQEVQEGNIKLATQRFGLINQAAAGLLADPDLGKTDISKKLWDTLGRATASDAMTAQHAVQFATQFPKGDTPTGLARQRQAILDVHAQTLDAWQRGLAYLGQTQGFNTGGGTKFFNVPAFGNRAPQDLGYQPSGVAPNTPQYGTNNQQVFTGGSGNQPFQPPGGNNLQPAPANPQMAPNRLGVLPPPNLLPTPARSGAPVQRIGGGYQPPGSIIAAPPPGSVEAQKAAGAGSGAELVEARHRSLNYRQEVFPLEQAIPALEKLGTKGTGPGTESINRLKSFILSNVPGADFKGLKDDVAAYDKAKKYLTDFVNQNGNAGTNDKLAASFAGNPSVNISNAAAADVAKTALALRRMKEAQQVEFEKSGKPDDEFAKFAGQWNLSHDPRAYGFDLMTPAQRKKVIESLPEGKDGKPGPRDLFKLQVMDAHAAGIINPNGLGK
jgi:hypothetical protein